MAITHPRNEIYLMNLIMSNYVSLSIDFNGIAGKTKGERRDEIIRLLDEYFMLCMGKTWNQLVADFESRPVLVVLRDIYEALKPYGGFGQGLEKPYSLRLFLEYLHPEIHIRAIGKDLDKDALLSEINSQDIIIFTIGNSDKQLYFNNLLKSNNCSIPVIYSWIEAGGNYSHLLKVEYNKKGCFQCLYTDEKGALIFYRLGGLEKFYRKRN